MWHIHIHDRLFSAGILWVAQEPNPCARLQTYLDILKTAVLLVSVITCWRNFLIKNWQDQEDWLFSCQWLIYKKFLERSLYEWRFFFIQPKGKHASHGHVLRIWEGISHGKARIFIWSAQEIWHNRSHFKINSFSQPWGYKVRCRGEIWHHPIVWQIRWLVEVLFEQNVGMGRWFIMLSREWSMWSLWNVKSVSGIFKKLICCSPLAVIAYYLS